MEQYDFSGWATRNNLKCADGRTIMKDAFKDNDGQTVPLVWNHQHAESTNVLGHALLENREEGVYAYCTFNDTEPARHAKQLVEHGDVSALSIYANKLKQNGGNVLHGAIREVSLVLAGANPGAFIDSIIKHGEESDEEAVIYTGEDISLAHSEEKSKEDNNMANNGEKTIQDVVDTMTEEQKTVMYAIIGQILEENGVANDNDMEDKNMKHNVFDNDQQTGDFLSHDDMAAVLSDAKRYGSLKDAAIAHGMEDIAPLSHAITGTYGIGTDSVAETSIGTLFPDARTLNNTPDFIQRDMGWVQRVMNAVHRTPFSRIKSIHANITADEARALGYIKGKLKKEEVFSLLKRTTTPTTIYKKQKLDRDDVVDITDFDVVAWIKGEMRMMLNEEIARAILIGDGRLPSSDDKINEQCIRPIVNDADLYTIKSQVETGKDFAETVKNMIRSVVKARKDYKGSGNPVFFTTEDVLTEALLLEDGIGHRLYKDVKELANAMRVSDIVTVPVMEGQKGPNEGDLLGIAVNLADYNVGADKGGSVNLFDDFDIDYNQQKYLIETRCSGALTKPYSAMVFETKVAG
jgi:hypothetical protein